MNRQNIRLLISLISILFLTLAISTNPSTAMSIGSNARSNITTSPGVNKDNLYKKILAYSDQHNIMPIDAKVDKVWKAIPGYNGLSVNIEASYEKMKASSDFDKNKVVYKEITPNIHLEDLAAEPVYRGNPQKPMVALLINVAWGNEYIPEILKVLHDSKVKATFFFDGSWVKKNPDLARAISEGGHEIGNHAYSHPDLKRRSRDETMIELKKTNDVIEATLGIKPKWFAPPSGSFNQETVNVAKELNMKTILWTVDTVDWKKPSPSEMIRRVVPRVENGSMVLMHPTMPVAKGLKTMITDIQTRGFQLGAVSDLMSEKRID